MKALHSRKGFFFILATLIVLSYIVASITLWTKSIEISERAYAEKFKLSNLELAVGQISQEKVTEFTDMAAYYTLYRINEIAVDVPIREGDASKEGTYFYVSHAFNTMIENGSLDPTDFETPSVISSYASETDKSKSFNGFFTRINDTISTVGLEVKDYSFSDFKLNQTSKSELNYSFNIQFSIADKSSHVFIKRNYFINGTLKIIGLTDPAILRETKNAGNPIEKQFFFLEESHVLGPYDEPKDVQPHIIETGTEGQGWFYGPAVSVEDADSVPVFARNSTILVGTFADIKGLISGLDGKDVTSPNWDQFGAYILTNEPETISSCSNVELDVQSASSTFNALDCGTGNDEVVIKSGSSLNKPFAVIPDFDLKSVTEYTYYGMGEGQSKSEKRILFVNRYSEKQILSDPIKKLSSAPKVYSIEELRDMAICGYYVHDSNAPSYLERLFVNPYSKEHYNKEFGIESFAFGTWIKDNTGDFHDGLSRLDKELFNKNSGNKIRGMPGCKTPSMSNADSQVGHFRIGDAAVNYLGDFTDYIKCSNENCEGAG